MNILNPLLSARAVTVCALFLCSATATHASFPDAPIVLTGSNGVCAPTQEICGDGIDQNCDGGDLLCPGNDKDRDGFSDVQDCDDTNRFVYPGIAVACAVANQTGWKTCQESAQFTQCATTPLCEAKGTGKCYYISKLTGSDSNNGSFNSPWKTYLNVVSYYSGPERPVNWKQLEPGDVVYFMSGVYGETYQYSGESRAFFLRNVHGLPDQAISLKAYPGHSVVFAPTEQTASAYFLQSSYIVLQGIEFTRGWGAGVRLAESSHLELRNSRIHNVDGWDNHNIAGLYLVDVSDFRAHHNFIHDNYDRNNHDTGGQKTENSRNVVLFGGGNNHFDYNVIFQSKPITDSKTGGCITYKHMASVPNSVFEVDQNIFRNCAFAAVGSGTFNSRIHHNLIIDSDPISFRDFGGRTSNIDNLVEFNTVVGSFLVGYLPTNTWGPIGALTIRKNIMVDAGSYDGERNAISVAPYGSDELYNLAISPGYLTAASNCYFNPNHSLQFNVFGRNGGAYGVLGGYYSFSAWQANGYDSGSFAIDPLLDAFHVPQAGSCASFGWRAN